MMQNFPVLAHFVRIMSAVTYSSEPLAAAGTQPRAAHFRFLNRPILLKRLIFIYAECGV